MIFLWGISIDPINRFGYGLISFYFIIPITSFSAALVLGAKNSRSKWWYPFSFGMFGVVIAIVVLGRISWVLDVLPVLTIPAFAGLGIGILAQKKNEH